MAINRRSTVLALALTAIASALSTSVFAQAKWDMPTGYPSANFHTENIRQFAADVEKRSNGKLKITLHDNGSLIKQNEIKRAVQTGQVPIGEFLLPALSNEDPLFGIDSIPFLTDSYNAAGRLWSLTQPLVAARFDKMGMKVLFSVPWPAQGVYSKKPLTSAADLKGSKWRAYSPQTNRIGELLGAQPVTIQAAELAQALATGMVETHMTSGATGVDIKVWDSMGKGSFFYDAKAWMPKNIVVVSKKAFDALDDDTRKAVTAAANDAQDRGWQASLAKTNETLAALEKNGMKVVPLPPAFAADLKKVGETMLKEWEAKAADDARAALAAYRK
jgi:TRAP-type transport system periplasmic protein